MPTIAGQDASSRVYSLFLCRGDVTISACQDCLSFAARDITLRCTQIRQETDSARILALNLGAKYVGLALSHSNMIE
ncbi:hypothetical protein ACOSQ4_011542 [Xanthoceras sorbifolium]